jgi:hypothetical protein
MKRTGQKRSGCPVALALTWDGARWPARSLPPEARAFLQGSAKPSAVPAAGELASLFAADEIREIRVCWVPRLKGGEGTLSEPGPTPLGKRIPFRPVVILRFGEVLGVVYRRSPGRAADA